jgi:hypothetical protein
MLVHKPDTLVVTVANMADAIQTICIPQLQNDTLSRGPPSWGAAGLKDVARGILNNTTERVLGRSVLSRDQRFVDQLILASPDLVYGYGALFGICRTMAKAMHWLAPTLFSSSSRYYGSSVRNLHYRKCRVPQLGDAFRRK